MGSNTVHCSGLSFLSCFGQSESQIKSSELHFKLSSQKWWERIICLLKMYRLTRHVSSDKKKIKLSSFNHYSQIKPKYSPEPTTLSCQIYDLKEIFAKINEHSHEWNFEWVNKQTKLVKIMLWGNNANNRRGKRRQMMKYESWDAPFKYHTWVNNNKNKVSHKWAKITVLANFFLQIFVC